jgi:hypothetical protein
MIDLEPLPPRRRGHKSYARFRSFAAPRLPKTPLEIYLLLESGAYHYQPERRVLELLEFVAARFDRPIVVLAGLPDREHPQHPGLDALLELDGTYERVLAAITLRTAEPTTDPRRRDHGALPLPARPDRPPLLQRNVPRRRRRPDTAGERHRHLGA